jgi:hypothetical protein
MNIIIYYYDVGIGRNSGDLKMMSISLDELLNGIGTIIAYPNTSIATSITTIDCLLPSSLECQQQMVYQQHYDGVVCRQNASLLNHLISFIKVDGILLVSFIYHV